MRWARRTPTHRRALRASGFYDALSLEEDLVGEDHEAGEVAARSCQTRDQARLDRVTTDAHDRSRARCLLGGHERRRGPGEEYVDLPTKKFCKKGGMLVRSARHPVLDDDGLALDIPVVAQALPKRLPRRIVDG
jgi:hypothetical protein